MPDLDALLAADARRSTESDDPTSSFRQAFDLALGRSRRRRRRQGIIIGAAVAVAAAVVVGGLVVSTNTSTQRSTEHFQLAADYHVIAPVPGRSGVVYAIGPFAGPYPDPDQCQRVPYLSVEINNEPGYGLGISFTPAKGHRLPPEFLKHPGLGPNPRQLSSGKYGVFTCRSK